MVEGPVTITLKNAILKPDKFKNGGKNLDPFVKVLIGKSHKWDS